jgi:hypothetical protein
MKVFLTDFYKNVYTDKRQDYYRQEQIKYLHVAKHYEVLVLNKIVSFEDFWQRYTYRCNVDRVRKELGDADAAAAMNHPVADSMERMKGIFQSVRNSEVLNPATATKDVTGTSTTLDFSEPSNKEQTTIGAAATSNEATKRETPQPSAESTKEKSTHKNVSRMWSRPAKEEVESTKEPSLNPTTSETCKEQTTIKSFGPLPSAATIVEIPAKKPAAANRSEAKKTKALQPSAESTKEKSTQKTVSRMWSRPANEEVELTKEVSSQNKNANEKKSRPPPQAKPEPVLKKKAKRSSSVLKRLRKSLRLTRPEAKISGLPKKEDPMASHVEKETVKTTEISLDAKQDDDAAISADRKKIVRKNQTPLVMFVMVSLVVIVVALGSKFSPVTPADLLCGPVRPWTTVECCHPGLGEAPWWAPAPMKEASFDLFCYGVRPRTQIEWFSKKKNDQLQLTVTAIVNRKVLLDQRGLLSASIHARTIIAYKTNKKGVEFQVPWGKGIVG